MVFDKMLAICLDFQLLGFQISDSIQNPDHLQPNLFSTIQITDKSRFQIPIVILWNYVVRMNKYLTGFVDLT